MYFEVDSYCTTFINFLANEQVFHPSFIFLTSITRFTPECDIFPFLLLYHYNIMTFVDQSMTDPSLINGFSSTTNGDASARISDQTLFQHQSQLQSDTVDGNQSISAGSC